MYVAILIYLVLNAAVFLLYGSDKRKAKKGAWRTKESTLLLASFFGPFGAMAGIRHFRHKTRKNIFKLVYLFAALHLLLIAVWIFG